MDITVIRGEGTSPGDDIVEPLLSDLSAALSRGRAELDQGALADEQRLEIAVEDIRLGNLVRVDDSMLGVWSGKVTAISHSISIDDSGNLNASSSITLRKPR